MFVIEVNGQRIEAATEKDARKALAKAAREERRAVAEREAERAAAQLNADAKGYRILARKARGEDFPRVWTFYAPGEKYAESLARPVANEWGGAPKKHLVETLDGKGELCHYGYDLTGVVCDGAGYTLAVFLRDGQGTYAHAVGSAGKTVGLAELPGIVQADFQREEDAPAADQPAA